MYLIPFYVVEPDLAFRETRVLNIFIECGGLPAGRYDLLEYYCPDPDCDCRRVMLNIVEEKQPQHILAAISYAFDRDNKMPGPFLDPVNPQSPYADQLLQLVEGVVLRDARYVARLQRHYKQVKRAATDPTHPAFHKIQGVLIKDEHVFPIPTAWKEKVGRNDPCPCGSGKKHKYCCLRK